MKHTANFLGILASQAAHFLEQWTDLNPGKGVLAISHAATGIEESLHTLLREIEAITQPTTPAASDDSESMERTMAALATQAWRMTRSVIDPSTKEPRETLDARECRGVTRSLKVIMDELGAFGITITDRTGETYDEGLEEKVIQGIEREDLRRPEIIETIKPSIFLHQKSIQIGDVIVGIPSQKDS